jgi:hypothetical protein
MHFNMACLICITATDFEPAEHLPKDLKNLLDASLAGVSLGLY